ASASIARATLDSSSGTSTSPCASIRSRMGRRNRRGTSGGGRSMLTSYCSKRVSWGDSPTPREPSVGGGAGSRALGPLDGLVGGRGGSGGAGGGPAASAGLEPRLGGDGGKGGEHALFGGVGGGQNLPHKPPLADFQRHVGERAADIDAEPDCRGGCHACALKPLSGNDSNVSDVSGQSTPAPARKSLARLPFSLHLLRPQARRRGVHACSQDAVPGLFMLQTGRARGRPEIVG